MKKVAIYLSISALLIFVLYCLIFGNLAIDIISDTQQNQEITVKAGGQLAYQGTVKKATGNIFQDIALRFSETFFPRQVEVQITNEQCETKTQTIFVFIPRTLVILIQDNCEVEFQNHYGRVAYF